MKKIGQGGNIITILPVFVFAVFVVIPLSIIDTAFGIMITIPFLLALFIQIKTRSVFIEDNKVLIKTFFFKKKYIEDDVIQVGKIVHPYYYIETKQKQYYFSIPFGKIVLHQFSLSNKTWFPNYEDEIRSLLNKRE